VLVPLKPLLLAVVDAVLAAPAPQATTIATARAPTISLARVLLMLLVSSPFGALDRGALMRS
jgi:hypothetical protein